MEVLAGVVSWRKCSDMTDQEKNLLFDFELKIKQIISRHETLKEEKRQLQDKIKGLEELVDQLRADNQVVVQKYENLKLAKMLVASEEENKDAKSRIQKIVREIDKCIALLNK
jgi:transcription antitermination factor NusA-like protein